MAGGGGERSDCSQEINSEPSSQANHYREILTVLGDKEPDVCVRFKGSFKSQ